MMEFYTDIIHKAKKIHECELCHQEISINEKYHRQSGKYDNDFFDRCLHVRCNNMISTYCMQHNENEYNYWSIMDWLSNLYCYDCEHKEKCINSVLTCKKIIKIFKDGVSDEIL